MSMSESRGPQAGSGRRCAATPALSPRQTECLFWVRTRLQAVIRARALGLIGDPPEWQDGDWRDGGWRDRGRRDGD
jgi:hypothetical protein